MATVGLGTPHRAVAPADAREQFALEFFDRLWEQYRARVSYVRQYEDVVAQAGGQFVNDHIAFRTFACQQPAVGIATLGRIFEALGYVVAGSYQFPDKMLSSLHFQHRNPGFPKLFVSELQTWKLSAELRALVRELVSQHDAVPGDELLAELEDVGDAALARREELLATLADFFQKTPWPAPATAAVQALNQASQFGAWVLVHGYNVNHFTALVNSHGVASLDTIDKTVAALRAAGVPMKAEIEGAVGSKLRQTATEAVTIDVPVAEGMAPWTYAYFEIAERNAIVDPETGRQVLFEGFLGPQATQLFEMTRVKA